MPECGKNVTYFVSNQLSHLHHFVEQDWYLLSYQ